MSGARHPPPSCGLPVVATFATTSPCSVRSTCAGTSPVNQPRTSAAWWWFTPSQPNRETCGVRALIGRRMTKQARHAGAHGVSEPPYASDDAQLDGCQPRHPPLTPSEVLGPCTRAKSRVGGFVREDAAPHRVAGCGDDRGLIELPRGRGHDLTGRRLSASTLGRKPRHALTRV